MIACPRSNLRSPGVVRMEHTIELPWIDPDTDIDDKRVAIESERQVPCIVEFPCVGRVSVAMLLDALVHGARGVLVLGRHQHSCRMNGAEDHARRIVQKTREVLEILGLDPDYVQFKETEAGPSGANLTIAQTEPVFHKLGTFGDPHLVETDWNSWLSVDTLSSILSSMEHIDHRVREELGREQLQSRTRAEFLARHGIPSTNVFDGNHTAESDGRLFAGCIPALHAVGHDLFAPVSLTDALYQAVDVLDHLGISKTSVMPFVPSGVSCDTDELTMLAPCQMSLDRVIAKRSLSLGLFSAGPTFGALVAYDGDPEKAAMLRTIGYVPVDVGRDPFDTESEVCSSAPYSLPVDAFRISRDKLDSANRRLRAVDRCGARAFLVRTPGAMACWALLTRKGGWRTTEARPMLGAQLAFHAIHRIPLDVMRMPKRPYVPCEWVTPVPRNM